MIDKPVIFKPPWSDADTVQAELLLSDIARNALMSRSGTYIGDGLDNRELLVGTKPKMIYIQRSVEVASGTKGGLFAISIAEAVSYVPGVGIVSDAVKSFDADGVTIGTNVNINESGTEYAFFAIG